jgi:uncharacterized membrane protein
MSEKSPWFIRLAARREWLAYGNLALGVVWLGVAVLAFRHLPERIPMHFVPEGSPTRWEPASIGRWLILPLVGAAIALVLPAIDRVHVAINRPYGILPPDAEIAASLTRLRRAYLDLCVTLLFVALGALHAGMWVVATGGRATLPPGVLGIAFGAMLSVLALILPLHRAGAYLREAGAQRAEALVGRAHAPAANHHDHGWPSSHAAAGPGAG